MPGTFIVFEGPDGCGTSLHAKLLAEKLESEGIEVLQTFEPTDGPIGIQIRDALHQRDTISPKDLQTMFCEDRAWHLEKVIQPALINGRTVISDRYFHSTIAYGLALGLSEKLLRELNKDFIQPDVLFYLLPPYEVCAERMGRREKHDALEEEDIQKKVYGIYTRLAEEDKNAFIIDTSGEKPDVADDIYDIVRKKQTVKS